MANIEVASVTGVTPITVYTFVINPYIFDVVDKPNIADYESINGSIISDVIAKDKRARKLVWGTNEESNQYLEDMITYFRSIEGKIRYFNFNDLDDVNSRWDSSEDTNSDWKSARVLEIAPVYSEGGKIMYSSIELTIQPE